MNQFTDPSYLRSEQYHDSGNLGARIQLHNDFTVLDYDFHRWLFDLLLAAFPPGSRILELGCGRGDLWQKNIDRIPTSWHITLSDFSSGMLADARKFIGDCNCHINYDIVDIQNIPYRDELFDGVIANFMLYHVPDREKAIGELRRVLKPEGSLHAVTLGDKHMHELRELIHGEAEPRNYLFGLENGEEQLKTSFNEVTMIPYNAHLEVTELAPLMEYIQSKSDATEIPQETINAIQKRARDKLASEGVIHISKHTGLFIARGYSPAWEHKRQQSAD